MSVGNNTIYMHGGYKGLYFRPKMYATNCTNEMWRLCRSNHKHFTWTQIYKYSTKCDLDNKMAPAPRYGHQGWNYQSQIFFRGMGYDPENYLDSCGEWLYAECLFNHDLNEKKLYSGLPTRTFFAYFVREIMTKYVSTRVLHIIRHS